MPMHDQFFINLPVKDLQRSMAFFSHLGYSFEERFTNERAACMVIGQNMLVMLLTEDFFRDFIADKAISDAGASTEVLLCVSCRSREEVDALVAKAQEAGGRVPRPAMDHGFMYGHVFEDLDGHIWEPMFMEHLAETGQPVQAEEDDGAGAA